MYLLRLQLTIATATIVGHSNDRLYVR